MKFVSWFLESTLEHSVHSICLQVDSNSQLNIIKKLNLKPKSNVKA